MKKLIISITILNDNGSHYHLGGDSLKKWRLYLCLILLMLLSVSIGSHQLNLLTENTLSATDRLLFYYTRIPRTLSLILAGATLCVCGAILQHIFQNKFVSVSTIGMMDSARLGILLVMLLLPNSPLLIRAGSAFLFAYLGVLLFLFIQQFIPRYNPFILPLAGIMLGNIVGSIASYFAYQFQLVQNLSSWLQGNFALVFAGNYELIFLCIPVLVLLYLLGFKIMIAGLGEELANSVGISYRQLQFIVCALIALACCAVLMMVGSIPFIGIVIPNIVSMVYGDYLKHTLILNALFGSCFLLFCDIVSRVIIYPYEIPVSVTAGIFGGIAFLFILFRRRIPC